MDGDLGSLSGALPSYEIGTILGRGAWGTVVSGHHRALNRAVAIKWLRPELVDDAEARRRFNAEAQVLAALDHPHVVRVYDYVEVDDVCALVMERLPGGTIADRTRLGPLPAQAACAYAMAALHGLEHAHHHEVLHRDVKPENLMLAADGRLRVTDFGIAAIIGGNGQRLTQTGVALGTPAYMAPEQLADPDRVGAYTDVWSTAAVLYELLARQVPYEARSTIHATLLARTTEDPRPVADLVPDVPPAIGAAVMRGLARDIDDRFPTCLDAADAIDSAATDAWGADWLARTGIPLQRTPSRARAAATGVVPVVDVPTTQRKPAERGPARGRKKVALWAVASVAVIGAVAAGIVLSGSNSPSAATSSSHWGAAAGPAPSGLPPVPAGWGNRLTAGLGLPGGTALPSEFGSGALDVYSYTGDPSTRRDFRAGGGSSPASSPVRDILASGSTPYLYTYTLRTDGHPNDVSAQGLLAIMRSRRLMQAYWQSTTELLRELGKIKHTLFLAVDPSVPAMVESLKGQDPRAVYTAVASSGVSTLRGIPNTFAGWAQAWVKLRDKLAPNVQLGWCIDAYGVGDHLIPGRPSDVVLNEYEQALSQFWNNLKTHFDYIDYTVGYGDGWNGAPHGVDMARQQDVTILTHWVRDMVAATHQRVVLSAIPVGNTIMRAENNTRYHYQDRWVQLILGNTSQAHANLAGLRNAGAIGLLFGYGYASPQFTCACDAAGDGTTNPAPTGTATQTSISADDDGGYLAQQIALYAANRLSI